MHFQVSAHLITMHVMQLLSLNSFKMYRVYKLDKQKLPPPSPTTVPLPPVPVYSWGMMKKDILSSSKVEAKRLPWYPVLLSSLDYKHLEDRDPHHSVLPRVDITLLDDSDQQTHWRANQEPAGCLCTWALTAAGISNHSGSYIGSNTAPVISNHRIRCENWRTWLFSSLCHLKMFPAMLISKTINKSKSVLLGFHMRLIFIQKENKVSSKSIQAIFFWARLPWFNSLWTLLNFPTL